MADWGGSEMPRDSFTSDLPGNTGRPPNDKGRKMKLKKIQPRFDFMPWWRNLLRVSKSTATWPHEGENGFNPYGSVTISWNIWLLCFRVLIVTTHHTEP